MTRALPLCLALVLSALAQQSVRQQYDKRNAGRSDLWKKGEISEAISILEELRRLPFTSNDEDLVQDLHYNLACGYSLLKQKDKALEQLRFIMIRGFNNPKRLQQDKDLDNIRQEAGFQAIVAELKRRQTFWDSPALKTPYQPNLSDAEKLAGLARIWSEAKHNFAWFANVPDLDWDKAYIDTIPRVLKTTSTLDYYRELRRLYALLRDGHTGVNMPIDLVDQIFSRPAIRTRLVEDKVLVIQVLDTDVRIAVGTEVLEVDEVPVRQYAIERIAPEQSASTPQDLNVRIYEYGLLSGPKDSTVRLKLATADGRTFEQTLTRLTPAARDKLGRRWQRFEFKILPGNVAHVILNTFGDNRVLDDFKAAWADIRKASAIVFDVRDNGGGSSGNGWNMLRYLTDKPFLTTMWRTRLYRPTLRAWGQGESWHEGQPGELPPAGGEPYLKPVAVLTSARTYSAAEDFVAVFDSMKRGVIVGEPTGGSTGQPLSFALPGGGSARVCTKADSYADGRQFVGVGIQPNILVRGVGRRYARGTGHRARSRDGGTAQAIAPAGATGRGCKRYRNGARTSNTPDGTTTSSFCHDCSGPAPSCSAQRSCRSPALLHTSCSRCARFLP